MHVFLAFLLVWPICVYIHQSGMVPPIPEEYIINVSIESPFIFCGDPIGVGDDLDYGWIFH